MSRFDIQIANEQKRLRVSRPRLVALAESTLRAEKVVSAEISVALVDDPRIHAINREFLQHDYPTDVISFLLESETAAPARKRKGAGPRKSRAPVHRSGNGSPRGAGKRLGGEIIISTETAARLAAEYDWRPIHEVSLYLVHGLLHLCGYDDLTDDEQRIMRAREIDVLRPWKITPHYAT